LDDPRLQEVRRIKIDSLRIFRKPPIIFLCGGKLDVAGGNGVSARNSLLYHLATNNHPIHDSITIAEKFDDWMNGAIYDDLLEFESDIAGISSVIVLILESAGALTELGLFVADKQLKKKTIAFISATHYQENSFVRLGPIKHIKEKVNDKHVCTYNWDVHRIATLTSDEVELMRLDLESITEDLNETETLDPANNGHLALVISELIKTFKALLLSEIVEYISVISGRKILQKKVRRSLFLLEKFGLVEIKRSGNSDYFVPAMTSINIPRIDFSGSFNIATALLQSSAFYETTEKESRRLGVINRHFTLRGVR
jgi:hypothetical protein